MTTTSDEQLEEIRTNMKTLKMDMLNWLHSEDWGRASYTGEYEEKFEQSLELIRKAIKLL